MKVFTLGGYGKVGLPAIELLAKSEMVSKIAIAGRNLERAEKAAKEIGEKCIAVQADCNDEEKLTALLAGYDIIMYAAYDGTVLPTIRAAIRAGTHYCDVNGVFEPALQLSTEAEAADITAIIANGIGPSITNLMGVHVASQLEQVEQLQLGFASIFNWESGRDLSPRQWLKSPKECLATLHEFKPFIEMMLQRLQKNGIRTVLDYQEKQWVEVDPIKNGLEVTLQQGGIITANPYASFDPFWGSMPSDLSRMPPVEVFFSPLPPLLHELLREYALHVIDGDIDFDTAVNSFYDAVERDPKRWLIPPDDFTPIPVIWARALGQKEGRPARCSCWFPTHMWDVNGYFLTSVALVAAVFKVLRGEIKARGVLLAEKAFEPQPFFDEVVTLLPDPPPVGKLIEESFEWLA